MAIFSVCPGSHFSSPRRGSAIEPVYWQYWFSEAEVVTLRVLLALRYSLQAPEPQLGLRTFRPCDNIFKMQRTERRKCSGEFRC